MRPPFGWAEKFGGTEAPCHIAEIRRDKLVNFRVPLPKTSLCGYTLPDKLEMADNPPPAGICRECRLIRETNDADEYRAHEVANRLTRE